MKHTILATALALVFAACGGSDRAQPKVVTPDGTQVPLPNDDGDLEEGEAEVEIDNPDGTKQEVEVDVDD